MELAFEIHGRINRPLEEVFEAVVNPETLSRYFSTNGAKGRMKTGTTVHWSFHDFPGEFPVVVKDVVQNEKIVFEWESDDPGEGTGGRYNTLVTMTFEALEDGRTRVSIAEEGWRKTEAGLKASYGNCGGWMQMMCSLKAHLEHGINLRDGMYE